ncbi:hypothetical protein [Chroococcidiopsis sp.]|uniref:hypothetical protein n=1 Tax=Chroococcidiopsis sp. TaxID=3088168 RepID=UPI003F2DF729
MARAIVNDLTGKVFGKITVLEAIPKDPKKNRKYKCLCACGKEFETYAMHIVHNVAKSCGCWKATEFKARVTKHSRAHTKAFDILPPLEKGGFQRSLFGVPLSTS